MRLTSRFLSTSAVLLTALLASCDSPTRPPTTGSIRPRIEMVRAEPGIHRAVTQFDSVFATVSRGGAVVGTPHELDQVSGGWNVEVDGLLPDVYDVEMLGYANDSLQHWGRTTGITVVAGSSAQQTMVFSPLAPDFAPPTATTTAFTATVTFPAAVVGATGYLVEASKSSSFPALGRISQSSPTTTVILQLPDTGTWFYRGKATIPSNNTFVRFSDPETFQILPAANGRTVGTANNVALTIGPAGGVVANRNITAAGPDTVDFFTLPNLRAGDTLTIEAVAGALTPPSPLDPHLLLLRQNQVDTVALDDDSGPGTDALIIVDLPANETYYAVVSGTAGHYEFRYVVRRNPADPTGLTAAVLNPTTVQLSWTDNAGLLSDGEIGYDVERCQGAACTDFAILGTTPPTTAANATTYDDAAVAVGNEYRYRLRARQDAQHFSAYTAIVDVSTVIPATPTAPSATTIGETQVDLTWADDATTESGYEIERCNSGPTCTDFTPLVTKAAGSTSHSDLTVVYGNVYRYRVRATSPQGASGYSTVVNASTEPPAAPTTLTVVTTGPDRISLGWTDNSSDEQGFRVERCTGATCTDFSEIGTTLANVVIYIDSTVAAETEYRYRVRAYHVITGQTHTNVANGHTRVAATPTGLVATVATAQVQLTWTDVADDELLYEVERCVTSSCSFTVIATLNGPDHVSYNDGTVVADETYTYRVRAQNIAGYSAYSNDAGATTAIAVAPSGLAATTVSGTRIDLGWVDNSGNETGFYVERCEGPGCTSWAPVGTAPADAVAFSDLTVTPGVSYNYQVRAQTAYGLSLESNTATATTFLPAPPSGLVATTLSNSSVSLTWSDDSDNESGFAIDRCETGGCSDFTEVATVGAGIEDYTDTGLNSGSSYTYRVRATNAVGTSAASNTASASTNLPEIPTAFAAEVTAATDITLSWTDNSIDELDQRIERCSSSPSCTDFAEIATVAADLEQYVDGGLSAGTIYRYRIRARNGAGYSDYSTIVSLGAGAPNQASGLNAVTNSATQINLSWVDGSDNETQFTIERCVGAACVDFAPLATVGTDIAAYVDNGVTAGNEYRYRVMAANGAGPAASFTNIASAHTFPPDAPTGLAASTFSSTRIDLTWADGGDYETMYELERCVGAACTDFALILTTGPDVVAYEDAGLTQGLIYRYRVRAVNAVAASAYDGPVNATTDIPVEPSDLTAVANAPAEVLLEWTDNSNNETGFILERCTGAGCGNFGSPVLLGPNVVDFTDGTVVYGETYRYRVRAFGDAGPSPNTSPAQVTLLEPAVPTDFTASTAGGTSVSLAWNDASDNEQGFRIERCAGVGCSVFAQIDVAPLNAVGYVDATAVLNESYTYRVRAFNSVGDSPNTTEETANTFVPADPSGFTATTIASDRIDLAWVDNADNESGYRIERCVGAGCSAFTEITLTGAGATGHQDLGLTVGESYSYRLTAINVAGSSLTIGPVTATTVLPSDPTDLAAVVSTASTIDLTWTDNAGNEAGYRIERCSGVGCSSFIEIATVGPDATAYQSTGLAMNSFYSHRVRAFNAAGTSAYTATVASNTFAPGPPSALVALTLTATGVDLTWNDNSANEFGFRIERCTGPGCSSWAEIATVGVDAENYVDLTAPAASSNSYRVRAYNGVGNSAFSGASTVSTTVPATPSALVAVAQGQAAIEITWSDNAVDETGYRVERCTGAACSDFAEIASLGADVQIYTDATVSAETAYRYRVVAFGNGSSDPSNISDVTTILPLAPSALTAIAVSDDRVDLAWTDNADNELTYSVRRCLNSACSDFAEIASLGADVVSYSDLTVAPGNTYNYVVVAENNAGVSVPSNSDEAATDIPTLPTGLTATVMSATEISLDWNDNAVTETGYSIERCTGPACTDFAEIFVTAADVNSYSDVSVAASTAYRYRVRAVNASGASGYTGIATAATNAPDQPLGLAAVTISATQIDLTWTDAANNEATYEVDRCDGPACSTFAVIATLPPNAEAYSDNSVTLGNTYTYRVRAINAAGLSPNSTEVTQNTFVPADPSGLLATTISASRIDLTWADNADNETAVRIERCDGGGCSGFAEVITLPAGTTAHSDVGLSAGLLYRYRVIMVNAAGESGPSNESEASTDFPIPPSAMTATTVSATAIDLTWSDNAGNEDDYQIERCVGDGCGDFTLLTTVAANTTSYQDATATLGNFYSYRVRATNFAGASDYTNTASANTNVPAAPTINAAFATSPTSVRVQWTLQGETAGYLVERCETVACVFGTVASVGSGTDQIDDAVAAGVTYTYRVVAFNAAGPSAPSAELVVSTNVPAAASGVGGIALSNTQVLLTWTDNANDETAMLVQRCSGAACGGFSTIATLDPNDTDYQDDGLAPGGVYNYRVISENAVGQAAPSAAAEVSLNAPQNPSALTATTTGPGQINLNWADNSDRELSYAVERCTGALCVDFVQVATLGINANFYQNTGLDLNAVYRFRVRALNNVAPSAYTNLATANTLLAAPASGLTSTTIHGNRVDLTWVDNSANEAGFRIQRCLGPGCADFAQISTVGVNVTAFQDNTVVYGQSYSYRIVAANISGDAAPSNTSTSSTNLNTPVGIVATTLNRTDIRVTWTDVGSFEQAYEVFRCDGPGCSSFAFIGAVGGGVTAFTDVGLAAGTDYSYRVRAATIGGASAPSVSAGARSPIVVANGTLISIPADTFQGRRHWVVNIPPGTPEFRVQFNPVGFEDPDLYVRRGAVATQIGFAMSDTLCAPFSGGVETCVFTAPPAGDFFITMQGFSAYSGGQIAANVQFEFNNCGQVGNLGPSQAQCNAVYAGGTLDGDVTVTGGIQTFTVPFDGTYEVMAIGAQGASGDPLWLGGRGAQITGTFNLTAGQVLKLAVGQMGSGQGNNASAGGGGGSFVVDNADIPLLVAGGGGGTRAIVSQNGCNASITQFGTIASGSGTTTPCTVKVDGLGAGGIASSVSWGSAGGGFFSNGAGDSGYGTGGSSWGNGLTGGIDMIFCGTSPVGGFGGGGSGAGCNGGGGGGGYSGGDGGRVAGGGGSYNTGSSPSAFVSGVGGHGRIRIRWVGP